MASARTPSSRGLVEIERVKQLDRKIALERLLRTAPETTEAPAAKRSRTVTVARASAQPPSPAAERRLLAAAQKSLSGKPSVSYAVWEA
jgi:hypothetical protein